MSEYVQAILLENLAAMRSELEFSKDEDGLVEAISWWLGTVKEPPDALKTLITAHTAASRSYRAVAAAGFLVAAGTEDPALLEFFRSGTAWLLNKASVVDGTPTGITVDGLAVLGVVLGQLRNGASKELKTWVFALKQVDSQHVESDVVTRGSLAIACALLVSDDFRLAGGDAPELCLSLLAKGLVTADKVTMQRLCERLYSNLRTRRPSQIPNEEIALALHAYQWVESNVVASIREVVSVDDLLRLLGRLESSFYRWTWENDKRTPDSEVERWDIQNEYHFQNFLWAVLKPVFPDLKEEEYVSSIGAVQSRIDLLIPSLKVIIEVKYRRKKMSEGALTREIAEDLGLYRHKRSDWLGIIPVIWDEVSRSDETAHLIAGLREMCGIVDAFVVTRPSRMLT